MRDLPVHLMIPISCIDSKLNIPISFIPISFNPIYSNFVNSFQFHSIFHSYQFHHISFKFHTFNHYVIHHVLFISWQEKKPIPFVKPMSYFSSLMKTENHEIGTDCFRVERWTQTHENIFVGLGFTTQDILLIHSQNHKVGGRLRLVNCDRLWRLPTAIVSDLIN